MKKITLILFITTCLTTATKTLAQVGIGNPAPAATLDITAANPTGAATTVDGILIPRVDRQRAQGMLATPTSTLIYVTSIATGTAAGTAVNITSIGFYYFDGAVWQKIQAGAASSDWTLLGNSGTTAGTNFIGTTDAKDLRIKTQGNDRWNISDTNNGQLQSYSLGTAAQPTYSWQGDQNTGIFSPGADNLSITTNGTDRVHVDASGNLGVGIALPKGFVDFNSTTSGIVMPRIALANTTTATAVNPQGGTIPAGTVVYNTATAGTAPTNVAPGLYFWDGTKWIAFVGAAGGLDWSLTGNAGTTVGTNFMGTTDAVDLAFKTTNIERARILSGGHIIVNATTNYPVYGADDIFESQAITDGDDAINGFATGTGIGVFGYTSGTGVGVLGTAGGATPTSYSGSGVSGAGSDTGAAGMATTVATGVGVRGNGNGVSTNTTSGLGAGVSGSGTQVGVFGHANATSGVRHGAIFTSEFGAAGTADNPYANLAGSDGTIAYGGYFDGNQDNNAGGGGGAAGMDYAYVGVVSGGTTYKILGTGSVSTMVKDENNERRILFAPESPEILFQDYGVGKLTNGIATIKIDPILAKNIFVDEKHPLKVFIQLEGDCNGVFVTNKSGNGFTVKELQNGNSNTEFSWQLIATRADMLDSKGKVHSKHVDVRFPIGPGPIKQEKEVKTEMVKEKEETNANSK